MFNFGSYGWIFSTSPLSLIVVAMNSRDQYEIIGFHKISHFISTLQKCLPENSIRDASKLLKQCSTLAKQSGKLNILIFSHPASQPACLP